MGRPMSETLETILSGAKRDIDHTLLITFPDATTLKFATSPIVLSGNNYANDLETVSELLQTLENPTDGANIGLQNKDRVLGLHLAANFQKWRKAEVVLGRKYYQVVGGERTELSEWVEMFRGAVQKPKPDDFQFNFDIIPDTRSAGDIVCNRTLAGPCGFIYKDPSTCGSESDRELCDHHLKSKLGCDGDDNSHHYGGTEHRYPPETNAPGTGGNPGVIDPPQHCPRLDQWTRILGKNGSPVPAIVRNLTMDDLLYNPVLKSFHRIKRLRVVRNEPIFEFLSIAGAASYASPSQPLIQTRTDELGRRIDEFEKSMPVLNLIRQDLEPSKCAIARDAGERADVMEIEMEDGHIYACGDSQEKMNVFHNKGNPIDVI